MSNEALVVDGHARQNGLPLLVAAVIVLRSKQPQAERPYRTWGYPIVPLISILLAALLIVDLAWLAPATSGIGIAIVLTGLPVYLFWRQRQNLQ